MYQYQFLYTVYCCWHKDYSEPLNLREPDTTYLPTMYFSFQDFWKYFLSSCFVSQIQVIFSVLSAYTIQYTYIWFTMYITYIIIYIISNTLRTAGINVNSGINVHHHHHHPGTWRRQRRRWQQLPPLLQERVKFGS